MNHARCLVTAFVILWLGLVAEAWSQDLSQPGAYKVGHMTFIEVDLTRNPETSFGGRPVGISVLYPVDPATIDSSTLRSVYMRTPLNDPTLIASSSDFEAHGLDPVFEHPKASANGPFPLVVFSPGVTAPWIWYVYLARAASHGFVVAILSHYGDFTYFEPPWIGLARSTIERHGDMSFALTRLLQRSGISGDVLYGLIDGERVTAAGHSLGAVVAASVTGGLDSVCETLPFDPFLGEPTPPDTCVPLYKDERFKAVVFFDGAPMPVKCHEFAEIEVPSLGTNPDPTTAGEQYGDADLFARQHAAISGHPKYRVDILNSRHMSYTNVCADIRVRADQGLISPDDRDFLLLIYQCLDPGMIDISEAHRIVTQYVITFLKANWTGHKDYQMILTPGWETLHEPDVQFYVEDNWNAYCAKEERGLIQAPFGAQK